MRYDDLRREIEEVPVTWLPALLIVIVQTAVKRKVFQVGGIEKTVQRAIVEANTE